MVEPNYLIKHAFAGKSSPGSYRNQEAQVIIKYQLKSIYIVHIR